MPPRQILQFERPIFEMEDQLQKLQEQPKPSAHIKAAIRNLRVEIKRKTRELFDKLTPWQTVEIARHPERPQTLDYLELVFDEFIELHGDKSFGDDPAMLSGFAKLEDRKVMFVGQHKGRNLDERNAHNYGMPNPEGYRKALAKMKTAAKFGLPIICFIDTPGANPGPGAEERGQAYQIAVNLRDMSRLKTPIICVIIGEGGSGGALGIGIGDHICVLQFAYYSVISAEGCAGILWKKATPETKAAAAQALKFTAPDLLKLGVIDEIIPEPLGGAHRDHRAIATTLKTSLLKNLKTLSAIPTNELPDRRYDKFRRIGVFEEPGVSNAS
jgi:acetyl-CoA carboxylase carboxyl transferase subunit alpha